MAAHRFLRALPGVLAVILLTAATTVAAVSGTNSLFYEGWGLPLPAMLGYLGPAALLLVVGLVALRWPAFGCVLLLVLGIVSGGRWLSVQTGRGLAPVDVLVFQVVVMVGPVILAALLFLAEARHRRLLRLEGAAPSARRVSRWWRELVFIGLPIGSIALVAAQQLPAVLARHDDGQRGARAIAGYGVTLTWAPQGPGWNRQVAGSGYPSWDTVTRYGTAPGGLCAHLNDDGTRLLNSPAGIWRMPTADEIVRSLSQGGANAGCAWDGRAWHAACRTVPDKETPLWAPDEPPIYYWSSQEADAASAYAVNYTGGVSALPKNFAGPAVGLRCVKAAAAQ
jgi:hypothetical protein